MLLQLFDRGERCPVQLLALKDGKPSLDSIEPRRPRRGEMEVDVWMFLEPAIALLMGVEIIEDDVQLAVRKAATTRFMKSRNSTRRRRLECSATILPLATSSAANKVVVPCRL